MRYSSQEWQQRAGVRLWVHVIPVVRRVRTRQRKRQTVRQPRGKERRPCSTVDAALIRRQLRELSVLATNGEE